MVQRAFRGVREDMKRLLVRALRLRQRTLLMICDAEQELCATGQALVEGIGAYELHERLRHFRIAAFLLQLRQLAEALLCIQLR
jgi:hypothetical protein